MSDNQYNAALTIFFVSYSVFEPLTNVLLKRMRPSVFIPIIMVLWVGVFFDSFLDSADANHQVHRTGNLHDMHGAGA